LSLLALLSRFPGCPVLVVGDLMLDEYVWGHVSRISPEAPVPVVEVNRRSFTLGGAANTAANISSLGGRAIIAGVVGEDTQAEKVHELLVARKIEALNSVDSTRPTTTKTRIIAGSQQMLRIDQEKLGDISSTTAERLINSIKPVLATVKACIISDYGKGVITRDFVQHLLQHTNSAGVPTIVDPKGVDYAKYRGASLVKPNQLEAGKVLNRELRSSEDVDQAGEALRSLLGGNTAILITRGAHGMSLFEADHAPVHVPAKAREVFDVTGAGDTVAGTMAMTLGVSGNLEEACRLASLAAAIVVGKMGTATCTLQELVAAQQTQPV
jgi:rfaE bifunctional protein kinase chain/domain